MLCYATKEYAGKAHELPNDGFWALGHGRRRGLGGVLGLGMGQVGPPGYGPGPSLGLEGPCRRY